MNKPVTFRQLFVWIAAAVSAPAVIYAGSASWEWTLIVGFSCAVGCLAVSKTEYLEYNGALAMIQVLGLAIVSGTFVMDISDCWETEGITMPLALIVLAALSAFGGAERSARASCVIAWILALLYIIILGAGTKNINLNWLEPDGRGSAMLITVFLIPAVSVCVPHERGRAEWIIMTIPSFAVLISVWCSATLSPYVARGVELPFYEYSKSLSLFGVAERFESLVSVVLTMGLFCVLSFLFSAAESIMRNGAIIAASGALLMVLLNAHMKGWLISVFTGLMWVILPLVRNEIKKKNLKKVLDKRDCG